MATYTETATGVVVKEQNTDDVQVVTITKDQARLYFDIEGGSPFGDDFANGLDLAQAAADGDNTAVLVLVIKDEAA